MILDIASLKKWLGLALLAFSIANVQADQNDQIARHWLERMSEAAHSQNYEGVIVYGDPKHWDSFFIRHANIAGTEYEHLKQLTGAEIELLRRGDEVSCSHIEGHQQHHAVLNNPLRTVVPHANLNNYYDFLLGDRQRIAGRDARQIVLLPKDEHRFGISLWLDENSALLLRSDLFNFKRQVLERAQFAQIEIGEPIAAEEFTSTLPVHPLLNSLSQADIQAVSWQPTWLPVGFKITAATEQDGAVRIMYGDGLAVVSIFIDEIAGAVPVIQHQWGATSAVVRRVETAAGVRRVTAVGELPVTTLLTIMQSVQPVLPLAIEQEKS